jgi:hypothetical protein
MRITSILWLIDAMVLSLSASRIILSVALLNIGTKGSKAFANATRYRIWFGMKLIKMFEKLSRGKNTLRNGAENGKLRSLRKITQHGAISGVNLFPKHFVIPAKVKSCQGFDRRAGIQSHRRGLSFGLLCGLQQTAQSLWIPAQRPNALSLCAAARQPCATHSVLAGMTILRATAFSTPCSGGKIAYA